LSQLCGVHQCRAAGVSGIPSGYRGLTREAYALDLRQFASWYHLHHLRSFCGRRPDIECFARDLQARGRARATVTRRLCTISGFYRYAGEEESLDVRFDTEVAAFRDRSLAGQPFRYMVLDATYCKARVDH
jgi:site-specific recombinase XerD